MRETLLRSMRLAGLLAGAWLCACGNEPPAAEAPASPDALVAEGPHDVAVIQVKGLGAIRVELLPELAPKTVENFVSLAGKGFYDGTTFHRVIPGFVIQGGDPNSRNNDPRDDGRGGPGYTIKAEFNAFPHVRGAVSMARGSSPNSAGSQFFIVLADSHDLDGQYTVFGRVIEGMDVADAVTRVKIDTYGRYGPPDRPYPDDVVIESIRIEPAAAPLAAPGSRG
jgi:peptidyl-prolyl cis-trans isomerase B (cyclophilin B)